MVKSFGDNGPIMDTGQLGVASMNTDVSRVVQYVNIKRFQKKNTFLESVPKKEVVKNPLFFTVTVIVRKNYIKEILNFACRTPPRCKVKQSLYRANFGISIFSVEAV